MYSNIIYLNWDINQSSIILLYISDNLLNNVNTYSEILLKVKTTRINDELKYLIKKYKNKSENASITLCV